MHEQDKGQLGCWLDAQMQQSACPCEDYRGKDYTGSPHLKGWGARLSSLCRILTGILATLRVEVFSMTHVLHTARCLSMPGRPACQGHAQPACLFCTRQPLQRTVP